MPSETSKNFFWKISSLLLGGGIYFLFFLFLMRSLGPTEYGQVAFALSWAGLLVLLVDFGFNPIITRDLAIQPLQGRSYFWMISLSKLFLVFIAGLLMIGAWTHDPQASGIKRLILYSFVFLVAGSFVEMGQAFAYAYSQFKTAAALQVSHKILIAIAGTWALLHHLSTETVILRMSLAALMGAFLSVAYFHSALAHPTALPDVKHTWKRITREALPLFVANVLILIYFRIDTLMLGWFRGNTETGLYNAAYRFLEVFSFIPTAYTAAIAAPYSQQIHEKQWTGEFRKHVFRSFALACGGCLLLQGIAYGLPSIFLNPAFFASRKLLSILSVSLLFIYPNYILTTTLTYLGKQTMNTVLAGLGVCVNIGMNLWAIPRWGAWGAAWATVLTEMGIAVVGIYVVNRYRLKDI